MMRIAWAIPAVPSTSAGIGRCCSMLSTLPVVHGASEYSGENSPVRLTLKKAKPKYSTSSPSRKPGMASPRNPSSVKM